jgi:hypothetical protein
MIAPAPARRHTSSMMVLARSMYGDGDAWTPTQIAGYLTAQGTPMDRITVRRWVDPVFAEQRRREQRDAARRRRTRVRTGPLLTRMRDLRCAGMPFSSIAIVLRVDWGVDLTPDAVRYYIRKGREPRLPKRRAART